MLPCYDYIYQFLQLFAIKFVAFLKRQIIDVAVVRAYLDHFSHLPFSDHFHHQPYSDHFNHLPYSDHFHHQPYSNHFHHQPIFKSFSSLIIFPLFHIFPVQPHIPEC